MKATMILKELHDKYKDKKGNIPFLKNVDILLKDNSATILKQNKHKIHISYPAEFLSLSTPVNEVHIKVTIYSKVKQIKSVFLQSRAIKSWKAAELLLEHGFKTPKAIAYKVIKNNFGIKYDYYISEYLPEYTNTIQFVLLCKEKQIIVVHFLKALAFEIAKMHNFNITHGDLNAGNILIGSEQNSFYITDIDRLKKHLLPRPDKFIKDFAALYSTLVNLLGKEEAENFKKFYLENLNSKMNYTKFSKKIESLTKKRNKAK